MGDLNGLSTPSLVEALSGIKVNISKKNNSFQLTAIIQYIGGNWILFKKQAYESGRVVVFYQDYSSLATNVNK